MLRFHTYKITAMGNFMFKIITVLAGTCKAFQYGSYLNIHCSENGENLKFYILIPNIQGSNLQYPME